MFCICGVGGLLSFLMFLFVLFGNVNGMYEFFGWFGISWSLKYC